jgi:hypothetical protein
MSFLNSNNSEYLSARITNRGRKAIANGNFNVQYFQIGDSEYDYNLVSLTGSTDHQKVFAPFDYDGGVKYPFGLDTNISTTYGSPISNNITITLRNEMGAAGFVSQYDTFGASTKVLTPITGATFTETYSGTTLETIIGTLPSSGLTGTNQITFTKTSGINLDETGYITLVLKTLLTGYTLDNQDKKVIKNYLTTGKTNSFIYRYSGGTPTTGTTQTITLDRSAPNLSIITGLTGNVQILSNDYEGETSSGNLIYPIDYTQQLNSWRLNTVWTDKPIGADNNGADENLDGYTSNRYTSVKNLLGYTKTGQTFTNLTGGTITGTSFGNSFSSGSTHELIEVSPSEQRCIAILHYSELGDISVDPERFFKYDDYISHKTGTTGLDISIVEDYDRENVLRDLSDSEYFEIYIPFIYYHRNTGQTFGARFFMDTTDYYVKSSINSRHQIKFRYLIDEQDYKVGKVFVNNKIIVFDDQELVATLDYRSNRRYTLPSPKLGLASHDGLAAESMLSTTGQTAWVTYMFENTSGNTLNSLPCNYFNKILSTGTPSQITMKFSGNSFSNMVTSLTELTDGFVADKFYALVQIGATPSPNAWKKIDLTPQITGYTSGYINPTGLTGVSFTINYTSFNSASTFDLEDHMSGVTTNYLGTSGATDFNVTLPQFGDEQPFPGSVRLVRATDIEQMGMMINLPSTQFTTSQNPTRFSGNTTTQITSDIYITEVALLDSNKEALVVAKTPTPVKRSGTQVFAVKLDF